MYVNQKIQAIVVTLCTVVLLTLFSGCIENDDGLEISIDTNAIYDHTDNHLNITIRLTNRGRESITVEPILPYSNLLIVVIDDNGTEIPHDYFHDYYVTEDDLIELKQNEYTEVIIDFELYYNFDIGIYKFTFTYSPSHGYDTWKGTVHSNEIEISVS